MLLSQCFMGNFSSGLLNSKTYANVANLSVDILQIWWVRGEEDQRDARLYTTGDFKFEGTHRHDLFHLRLPTNGPFDYKVTHRCLIVDKVTHRWSIYLQGCPQTRYCSEYYPHVVLFFSRLPTHCTLCLQRSPTRGQMFQKYPV